MFGRVVAVCWFVVRIQGDLQIPELCLTLLVSTLGAGVIFLNFKKCYTAVKRLIMT